MSSSSATYTNYKELYESVKNQNEIISVETTRLEDIYSTNNRRAQYTLPKYQWLVYINFFLWCLYYILTGFCIYLVFYGKESQISRSTKIMICIAFLVYPMVILTLEIGIHKFLVYLYALISGNPHQSEKNDKPPFSLLDIMPPGYY